MQDELRFLRYNEMNLQLGTMSMTRTPGVEGNRVLELSRIERYPERYRASATPGLTRMG